MSREAEQLAQAQKRIEDLEARLRLYAEHFSLLDARLYCLEHASGLRSSAGLGLDGLRFGSAGIGRDAAMSYAARVKEILLKG